MISKTTLQVVPELQSQVVPECKNRAECNGAVFCRVKSFRSAKIERSATERFFAESQKPSFLKKFGFFEKGAGIPLRSISE
ncbi:MAG: hypothetical protein BWK80_05960 [Desulfobacteraceae bacterium IS3]|nr:MAG: hypothetical protein BWK80_05960 [Desulfobacteraceae bacterium IS3]